MLLTDRVAMALPAGCGGVIRVPEDYPNINIAIDNAVEGNLVLVSPRTYYEYVIVDKAITLGSLFLTTGDTSYIDQTVITEGSDPGMFVANVPNNGTSLISGFTITNSNGTNYGGVLAYGNHHLDHLNVVNNTAQYAAGGICAKGSPLLTNLKVTGNTAGRSTGGAGGGIELGAHNSYNHPVLRNVIVADNWAGCLGSAIYLNRVEADLENVLIVNNTLGGKCNDAGSVHIVRGGNLSGRVTIRNSIIRDNSDRQIKMDR